MLVGLGRLAAVAVDQFPAKLAWFQLFSIVDPSTLYLISELELNVVWALVIQKMKPIEYKNINENIKSMTYWKETTC